MRCCVFPLIACKCVAVIALAWLSLILSACSGEPGTRKLETYHARLSNVLDFSPSALSGSIKPPAFPRPASLRFEAPREELNLLDFLSLYGCELQLVVANQNAALGRVARPSQRLLLHLQFLDSAPACLVQLKEQGKSDLFGQLEMVFESKKHQLPAVMWQALLGAEEARAFWKKPVHLKDYPENTGREPVDAIAGLSRLVKEWQAGRYDYGWKELEGYLDALRKGDGGALLKSWALIAAHMQAVHTDVKEWLATRGTCTTGQPGFDANIFSNVVRKFFVGEVQPWAAGLNRRFYELIEPVRELERLLGPGEPEAYANWRMARAAFIDSARASMKSHVLQIGELQSLCK